MKRLLLLAVLVAGCASDEEPEYPILGDGTSERFDEWDADCDNYHGSPCNYEGLTIRFADFELSQRGNVTCTVSGDTKTVELRRAEYQPSRVDFYRAMGRCVLGRHDDGEDTVTIMGGGFSAVDSDPGSWLKMVKDLFQRSEPTTERDPLGVAREDV